jgi:hypothetical protein
MRWAGIDEAGYGPNLGPLVMTAVVAEGPGARAPDVWGDLPETVCKAGGPAEALWIDDSKRIHRVAGGRERLEVAKLAALAATGRALPTSLAELHRALGAGTLDEVELTPWIDAATEIPWPRTKVRELAERTVGRQPLECAAWKIVAVRSVVVGPARFNAMLEQAGSKAKVHFAAFAQLLAELWRQGEDGAVTNVRSDKHGGRHFYLDPLHQAFPDTWIDRGPEGPSVSRYTIRSGPRRLELCLQPRAESEDGLVALASMISKAVREVWMEVFNAYWTARIPGLRPTAGYPVDAARFKAAIEPSCQAIGLAPNAWWRSK